MAQRAMIAAMLASSPDLLIADEPTSAHDVIVREQVLRLIDQLIAEEGLASSSSATDLPMVARFCERILVIHRGRLVDRRTGVAFLYPRTPCRLGGALTAPIEQVRRRTGESLHRRGRSVPVASSMDARRRPR